MRNKKYYIVLILFSLLLIVSLINIDRNTDLWSANDKIRLSSKPMEQVLFKVGVPYGPSDLDLHDAWNGDSFHVIEQVCEGLFAYNLSDPDNSIIPNLALSGTWNPAGTEYTCVLRQGVTFHDGASFNADAVNFTWNRLNWALNVTGTNFDHITIFEQLYEFPDGRPIVSSITKNNDYNVTFVLNDPYVPFEALLCFSGSFMLSPSSTPATSYIDTGTGDLVGTGPFVYDNYTPGVEVNFHAFDNYWKGKANITGMRFVPIANSDARNTALLTGNVHFIRATTPAYYSAFRTSPDITFLNTSTTDNTIYYLGMNNELINATWREAISYAIDYDYIINTLKEGNAERAKSPLPESITYANSTFDEGELNVSYARTVLQSMGFGGGLDVTSGGPDETIWQSSTFLSLNFTYNEGNTFRENLLVLLGDNLGKIGIVVEDAGMSWEEYTNRTFDLGGKHRNMLQLYWFGWAMDYNDPSNFINPLFSNTSIFNSAQYNGYTAAVQAGRDPLTLNDNVQLLMDAALSEVDPTAREALYDRIQELLIEEDYPWAWGYNPYVFDAHNKYLTGFQQNAMTKFYFYPCEWSTPILPGPMSINSDADVPDTDGNFNITWSVSTYADNYSLYVSSSPITVIDGSVTVLLDEVTDTSYEVTGYSDGNYYFQVVARNGNGNTSSSNLLVNVDIPAPPSPFTLSSDAGSPDTDGNFDLTWTSSNKADNYSLYVYSSLITEINGSLTLLLAEVTDLSYDVSGYLDGTYFFVVVANNTLGTTLSNNIEVVVEFPVFPAAFTLSSDADSPDTNGDFNLTWTPSTFADTYSLYVYSSLITEINGSLTLLLNDVTDLSYEAVDYLDGTYFFAVVAKNTDGTTLSNNIEVVVDIDEITQGIPGFEMWTMVFSISSVALILIFRKKKKIT